MSSRLSYRDAVLLLGGQDNKLVTALDRVTSGLLLGALPTVPAVLGWFEAKAEFVRLCQDLIREFGERRNGLSRVRRTERLLAALSVIVVAAFFEALEVADLPFRFGELELTKAEQVALATDRRLGSDYLFSQLLDISPEIFPAPHEPYEAVLRYLEHGYYPRLSRSVYAFIEGLAVWEQLTETERERFGQAIGGIPVAARRRYEEMFRQLAVDFPEVDCWASLREHQATRAEVRRLGTSLSELERLLGEISTGRPPSELRAALARAHRADLERPVVDSGDVPEGLRVPVLREAYIPALFRVRDVRLGDRASDEAWWDDIAVRDDLEEFFVGYLTSPQAVQAPLLVLGQPGSGKSVLTRVLAARLPAPDFLPVRVVLREVQAAADIQDQLEQAIRDATGEQMSWPGLARSADDALPVIMLDGFDELLQATGASQSDYLGKVAAFQLREADQGRPVAAIVTSRTSVAGWARPPKESVVLRLEPFDASRVTAWLRVWNAVNATYFATRGLLPLTPETVLAHHDLAGQPLLLLMLALYDMDGNALQQITAADLRQGELYERLLRGFASREIMKHRPGISERDLDMATDTELRRLSVVAFAMFNRGTQWVTEVDLDKDLAVIFGAQSSVIRHDLRAPLGAAEIVLGRFFFVYRSRALRDDTRLETYEFLHATFGEFLIARLTCEVLSDIAARYSASSMPLASVPDDDLLNALLSFRVLSLRASTIGFLSERFAQLSENALQVQVSLLKRLFRSAHDPHPGRRLEQYCPQSVQATVRHASYSANLLLLAVCASGSIRSSELLGSIDVAVHEWHRRALLWRSQLSVEEWTSLVETIILERLRDNEGRDIQLGIGAASSHPTPSFDPTWTYNVPPIATGDSLTIQLSDPYELRRKAYFLCGVNDDVVYHALSPLFDARPFDIGLEEGLIRFSAGGFSGGIAYSHLRMLMDLTLLPLKWQPEERESTYRLWAEMMTTTMIPTSGFTDARWVYRELILDRLAADTVEPRLAADIMEMFASQLKNEASDTFVTSFIRCGLAFLGEDHDTDQRLAEELYHFLMPDLSGGLISDSLEAWVRLGELGLPVPPVLQLEQPELMDDLLRAVSGRRPDLGERVRRQVERLTRGVE